MDQFLAISIVLLSSLRTCLAQGAQGGDPAENSFIVPAARNDFENITADVVWGIGQTQTLRWTTTISAQYRINLWYNQPGQGAYYIGQIYQSNAGDTGDQSYNWTVSSLNHASLVPGVFFLWLQDVPTTLLNFTSHYFNVSATAPPSSTTLLATSTSASTTATSVSTSPIESSTNTVTPSPSPSPSSNNSLAIGLGIGLGVGIPLILAIGLWLAVKKFGLMISRKPSQGVPEKQGECEARSDLPPDYPYQENYKTYKPYQPEPASELPGQPPSPVEIGSRH